MAEFNEFDNQLKDALSNLGNDISPGDWDSFAEKLGGVDGFSPIDESAGLDDVIRNQMENLEINTDVNHWDALESKIDQELNVPEISDEAIDQLASNQLSNLYIPYNPTHWTLMSHRLEEEFNVRRKILNYKITEFSLMVLLLLTIIQFMPSYPSTSDHNLVAEKQTEWLETNTVSNSIATANSKSTEAAINSKVTSALASTETINSNSTIILDLSSNSATPSIIITENNTPSIILSTPSETVSIVENKEEVTVIENLTIPVIIEDAVDLSNQSEALVELPVNVSALDYTTDWSTIGVLKKFPKKVVVRIGAMSSADLNHIKTPSTSHYKDNSYQQYQLGYGGGITLDFNYEKLTFSTGLIYRRINFYPQEEGNVTGSFADGYQSHVFDAVNLNLLTIPMNFQFQMNNPDKKWKLHAITGASLNVLALNHYNITVNNIGNNITTSGIRPTPGPRPGNIPQVEIEQEADIAGEGLFEGGSFHRNHYFTANFGIGVERYISSRWSLFVQPVYQHKIFGKNLGLNRDRIHTLSIQVGAKSTFK